MVDEAEREIVRAEIRNREPIKLAWGLGATVSRLEIRTEFRKVDGAAWQFEVDVEETTPPS